LLVRSTFEERG